ncbi:MAG: LPS export ABC transporter periplasmic protein LptC [Methyloceanibacter sp.]|uniref:LPS export ABC transporter periplasmic protein LptC n=1 Tax=Methyloceanibacter sp. TaxID=1965321 RepID=UPI003D6CE488
MASEANTLTAGQRYHVGTAEERDRAFSSAARHSRVVHILRRVLPVVAVLVLAAYFISTRLNVIVGDMTASIDGMEVADGNLRMLNPTLKGADKKNGNYVVRADHADQDIKNPKMIKLHAIKADVSSLSGGWSRMQAIRGIFNSEAERLVLQDRITVATSAGVTGELKHATLDMKTQTLRSHRPVFFKLTNGTVKAKALTLHSADKTLVFRGQVAVHLIRQKKQGDAKPQANAAPKQVELPPPPSGEAQTVNPQ